MSWNNFPFYLLFQTKHEARVAVYEIPQGQPEWKDTKYTEKAKSNGVLKGGVGCLVDKKGSGADENPLVSPECWIGWRRDNVTAPYIKIELTRSAPITGIRLSTYVDEGVKAETIMKFVVHTSRLFGTIPDHTLYACTPKEYYHISPRVVNFDLDFGDIMAQYITLEFEYSSELIFIRQFDVMQG